MIKLCFKILFGTLLVAWPNSFCYSQNAIIDSLEMKLKLAEEDSNKVIVLLSLSRNYAGIDRDRSMALSMAALDLSEKLHYTIGEIESYGNMGDIYRDDGNHGLAVENLNKALALAEKVNSIDRKAAIYNSIGHVYRAQGKLSDALNYFYKALIIFESLKDTSEIASSYNNLGIIYRHLDYYQQSLYYLFKNLELMKTNPNKRRLANCYNNIGATYTDKGDYENALIYHQKALSIRKTINNKQDIAASLINLSSAYALMGNVPRGLDYIFQCLQIDQELGQLQSIAQDFSQIGEMYSIQGDFPKSIDYSLKGLEIAKRIGAREETKHTYLNLANAYAQQKDFKNAFKYRQLFKTLNDSLYNERNIKQINEMIVKYETVKKENEIAILNKDNDLKQSEVKRQTFIKNVFIFGFIVLFVVAFVLYRNIRFRQSVNKLLQEKNKQIYEQKELIADQKAILEDSTEHLQKENILAQYEIFKNQINPHFLFNSLNAISSLIHTDQQKAVEFTNQFSKVYHYIIALKEKLTIKIEEELDLINSYLFLQKIRFGENLIVEVDIANEQLNGSIPPFSLQLLVENAIKHNIISTEHPLNISIKSTVGYLTVTNNLQKRTEKIASTGIGLKNLTDRYHIVSKIAPKFWSNGSEYIAHIPIINE